MELRVTRLITEYDPYDFAHSAFEGGPNAGQQTFRAALECPLLLINTSEREAAARDWLAELGAWDRAEMAQWSRREVNALIIQFVAGAYRSDFEKRQDPLTCSECNEAFWCDEHTKDLEHPDGPRISEDDPSYWTGNGASLHRCGGRWYFSMCH